MKQPIVVAIIPARGGSKRLKRKNVLPFCGRPLVEWTIIQCCCTHCLGPKNTYLSTDDDEIAEIGKQHGINIIRRPFTGREDELTGNYWIKEALKKIMAKREIDLSFNILPTSPIRFPEDFDRTYLRYQELKPLYPDCHSISWSTPHRETVVHRYHDDYRYSVWLMNKSWWFGTNGPATDIYEPEDYIKTTATGPNDREIAESSKWLEPGIEGSVRFYIQGKWFQCYDVDDRDSFEFNELLMERFVLKGRGAQIYYDYRDAT